MKKTIILQLSKTKKIFKPAYIGREYGNLSLLVAKKSLHAISKLKKNYGTANIIISHSDADELIWKNKCKQVRGVSYKTALPVLEKICRQTADKYNIKIPFGEIYIVANPLVACAIANCLSRLAKIFTVISPECPLLNIYDELYFKHGTIIRHLPEFNNNISEDSIIIRYGDDDLPLWANIPVIDFSEKHTRIKQTVHMEKIYVTDENIGVSADVWGGKSGLEFYELMGEIPTLNSIVDINITPDAIFLLDTSVI